MGRAVQLQQFCDKLQWIEKETLGRKCTTKQGHVLKAILENQNSLYWSM